MATIGNDKNGRKRILFVASDGSRKTIRLGKATAKQAEAFKLKLEALIGQSITGSVDDETSRWLASLPDAMHQRVAATGLIKARNAHVTALKMLLDAYFDHLNVKPITALGYQATRTALLNHFGAETSIGEITPLAA